MNETASHALSSLGTRLGPRLPKDAPPYYYWEAVELWRRVAFVGVLPLASADPARRAALGTGTCCTGQAGTHLPSLAEPTPVYLSISLK